MPNDMDANDAYICNRSYFFLTRLDNMLLQCFIQFLSLMMRTLDVIKNSEIIFVVLDSHPFVL